MVTTVNRDSSRFCKHLTELLSEDSDKNLIRSGMDHIEDYTCVRFVPWTGQNDFITILSDDGCFSNIGKVSGEQLLSLNKNGCMLKETIVHELIHALGYGKLNW
jgi:hypothetical protein